MYSVVIWTEIDRRLNVLRAEHPPFDAKTRCSATSRARAATSRLIEAYQERHA